MKDKFEEILKSASLEAARMESTINSQSQCDDKIKIDVNSFTLGAMWILEKLNEHEV